MTQETPADRKQRLARDRQQARRDRIKARREAMGAEWFKLEMGAGTRAALKRVCEAGQFEEDAEALTLLIHGAADLARRDPVAFAALVDGRQHE